MLMMKYWRVESLTHWGVDMQTGWMDQASTVVNLLLCRPGQSEEAILLKSSLIFKSLQGKCVAPEIFLLFCHFSKLL